MTRRVFLLVRNKYTASLHLRRADAITYVLESPPLEMVEHYDDLDDGLYEVTVSDETLIRVAESKCGIERKFGEGFREPGQMPVQR